MYFNLFNKSAGTVLALSMSLMTLSGCGSKGVGGMVAGMAFKTYLQDGNLWAEAKVGLDIGNMVLAGIDVPITSPRDPSQILGHVAIRSNWGKSSELFVTANLSAIYEVSPVDNVLPNGTAIPVTGFESTGVALPVGKNGGRLYLGLGDGVSMLGFALPFKELEKTGQYVPGLNIFNGFASGGVDGVVGLFFGASAGQSGLGLFIRIPGSATSSLAKLSFKASSVRSVSQVQFLEVQPSKKQRNKLYWKLNELNNRGTQLHFSQ